MHFPLNSLHSISDELDVGLTRLRGAHDGQAPNAGDAPFAGAAI